MDPVYPQARLYGILDVNVCYFTTLLLNELQNHSLIYSFNMENSFYIQSQHYYYLVIFVITITTAKIQKASINEIASF